MEEVNRQIDSLLDSCVHCGLCLEVCPTFVLSGNEAFSPRGRIHVMRSLHEQRFPLSEIPLHPLDSCLGCRACETACPSGVEYGSLLEHTRRSLAPKNPRSRLERFLVEHVLWRGGILEKWLGWTPNLLIRFVSQFGRRFPGTIRQLAALIVIPESPRGLSSPSRPWQEKPATVTVMRGCVARALFPRQEESMVYLLQQAGYSVALSGEADCCGAMAAHAGCGALADRLSQTMDARIAQSPGPVLMTASGCTAHVHGSNPQKTSQSLTDLLADAPRKLNFNFNHDQAAWHSACHSLHGGNGDHTAKSILQTAGLSLIDSCDPTMCCGSAGSYNIALPQEASRLGEARADVLAATGTKLVLTENPGCLVQLQAHAHGRFNVELLANYLYDHLESGKGNH